MNTRILEHFSYVFQTDLKINSDRTEISFWLTRVTSNDIEKPEGLDLQLASLSEATALSAEWLAL